MSQPPSRDYVDGTLTSRNSFIKKADDDADRRKSQAQRLLEFEMWTNGDKTLKDLEYSQRRTEKKQRKRERRRAVQNRFWKKLYAPAMFGMVGGTFLTLCGTLESLGGGTIFWDARPTLVVLGPALLSIGFLCLMLAAGCTSKHDQHARLTARNPSSGLLLPFQESQTNGSIYVRRSTSVDTTDMPVPEDLDPSGNGLVRPLSQGRPRRLTRARNASLRSNVSATSSAVFLKDGSSKNPRHNNSSSSTSYSATASWVHDVSTSHRQTTAVLTRQSSDSNLWTSSGRHGCESCDIVVINGRKLPSPLPQIADLQEEDSQTDLRVNRTRSLSSSGYQSAGDSPTSKTENNASGIYAGNKSNGYAGKAEGGVTSTSAFLCKRQNFDSFSTSAPAQTTLSRNAWLLQRIRRGSADSGLRQTCFLESVESKAVACAPAHLPGTVSFKRLLSMDPSHANAPNTQHSVHKHQRYPRLVGKNYLLGRETGVSFLSSNVSAGSLSTEVTNMKCVVQNESSPDVNGVQYPRDGLGVVIVHKQPESVECTAV